MTVNTAARVDRADELIGLLERQSALYQQLTDLTEQQSHIIVADLQDQQQAQPGERLLGVLAHRQRVIDQLVDVHDQLAPYREHWPAVWSGFDESTQNRIKPLVRQIEQMAANIVQQDENDRQRLEHAQARVGAEVRKLNSAGAALNAYKAPMPTTQNNRFTNEQG